MPNIKTLKNMSIEYYKDLISTLPVREQSFTTKRTTWSQREKQFSWFKEINDSLFQNKKTLIINRKDIFETSDFKEKIIKTIYWGYPSGMRGKNAENILNSIESIEEVFNELKQTMNPTEENLNEFIRNIKGSDIRGLGLSTYSKLLYFSNITFNNNPCLILDRRLINVFSNKVYKEFNSLRNIKYDNAEKSYYQYIELMHNIAQEMNTNAENIEQFLFIFGNTLKPS